MFTQNKFFYFVAAALLSTSSAAFWPLPADAHADPMMGEEVPLVEQISDFDAAIAVNPDATIEVTEKITVYFPAPRHGIDREIPVRYRARFGNRQTIRLTVESVTDQNGSPLPYALSRLGGDLRIRIGDPNRTVAGEQVYRITYRVARVLLFFSDHDELYWNVTGNRWRLPLSRAEAAVTLPVGVPAAAVSSSCYTGSYGSTAQDCAKSAADGFYQFTSDGELTIAIGWPKGFVRAPTKAERARDFLLDNAALAVPVLVFIILFRLWWRRGRDPKIKTIMAEYEPPDELGPAVLSGLVRERVGSGAISATIVELAVRGYLTIAETKDGLIFKTKSYTLNRTQKSADGLQGREGALLKSLFGGKQTVTLKDLRQSESFQGARREFQEGIIRDLTEEKYFADNPQKIRVAFTIAGVVLLVIFFYSMPLLTGWLGTASFIGLIVSAALVIIFGWVMPRRLPKGAEAYRHALGFKLYLSTAEKYRLEWQEKEKIFEKFLPYAMIFGVVGVWAAAFKGLGLVAPVWYVGGPAGAFNPVSFGDSLNSFSSTASQALAPSSSGSSGGGSSGGGFGGGGGGSW